jgi:hypothetical protein
VDAAAGQIGVTIWSDAPITSSAAGSLVTIVFHRTAAAASGTTTIDVASAVNPDGDGVLYTQVGDSQGPYTLSPAPTDGYNPQIDGVVELGAVAGPDADGGDNSLPVTVVDTGLPVLTDASVGVVAGPAILVSAGSAARAKGAVAADGAQQYASVPGGRATAQSADGLFAALGRGAVDVAEWTVATRGMDSAVGAGLASQAGAAGAGQANLDRFLWDSEDSNWQNDKRDWLF